MCLGTAMQLVSRQGDAGLCCDADGRVEAVDLSLLGCDLQPGAWLLAFLGRAERPLTAEAAQAVILAHAAVAAVMAGRPPPEAAFADLTSRPPALPPHLAAALAAGQANA